MLWKLGAQCTERLSKLPKVTQLLSGRVTFVSQQSGCGPTLSQPICQQADSEVRGQPIQGLCAGLWDSQDGQLRLCPLAIRGDSRSQMGSSNGAVRGGLPDPQNKVLHSLLMNCLFLKEKQHKETRYWVKSVQFCQ